MTRELPPPLVTPAQAAMLLDQVIYEQVVECIDLDALHRLEQSLTMQIGELDGVPDDRIYDLVTALLDRALLRVPGEVRRYLRAAAWPAFGGCELCDDETRAGHPAPDQAGHQAADQAGHQAPDQAGNQAPDHASQRRSPTRLKS